MRDKVLVTAASKHGATKEIAAAIAAELGARGLVVDLIDPAEIESVAPYAAVVVGSAVYAGSWLSDARDFVAGYQDVLRERPVWLFSSGPLGEDDPQPKENPRQLDELMAQSGARGHQIFAGELNKEDLNFGEKLIVKAVKAPYGDFRDWTAIRSWAAGIAAELHENGQPT